MKKSCWATWDSVYNLARWITGHDQDAEDVVQETYIRAFRAFDNYSDINSLGWLLTIVRTTSYNYLKSKYNYKHLIEFDEAVHSSDVESSFISEGNIGVRPDTIISSGNQMKLIHDTLREMPLIFREVIVLHEIEEMSYKEIAEIVGVPTGTVMSRLSRGRKRLQQALASRSMRNNRNEL